MLSQARRACWPALVAAVVTVACDGESLPHTSSWNAPDPDDRDGESFTGTPDSDGRADLALRPPFDAHIPPADRDARPFRVDAGPGLPTADAGSADAQPATLDPGCPSCRGVNGFEWVDIATRMEDGDGWGIRVVLSQGARLGDVDGDGDLDVAAVVTDDAMTLFRNLGGGRFARPANLFQTPEPATDILRCARMADIDADGDLDLAFTFDSGGSAWLPNLGGGSFGDPVSLSEGSCPLLVDLDVDGVIDLLLGPGPLTWSRGLGDGRFAPGEELGPREAGLPVHAEDLDGDGLLDIVSGPEGAAAAVLPGDDAPRAMQWHRNLGSGVLAEGVDIGPSLGPYALNFDIADLDQDGDPDFALAPPPPDPSVWFRNRGDGGWDATVQLPIPGIWFALGDLDGDGDHDLVSGIFGGHAVIWHANRGDGSFDPAQRIGEVPFVADYPLAVGDLDGDGRDEVVTATYGVWNDPEEAGPALGYFRRVVR